MEAVDYFQQYRSSLQGLAYRMLGSVVDAEDVVQDAYLRWHKVDRASIENPQAYLTTVVSRLCLDRLGEARHQRETYIGPWLPEPVIESPHEEQSAHDISFALMLALERLSPLERAAFLLHDVFDYSFADIAVMLERSEAACRQLAKRAREHLRTDKPRFQTNQQDNRALAEAFFGASRQGDVAQLQQLLLHNAVLHSDGGGRRQAALRLITGADKICRLYAGIARKWSDFAPLWSQAITINGAPGMLSLEADGLLQAVSVRFEGDRIADIYVVRNPEKLLHLLPRVPEEFTPLLEQAAAYYRLPLDKLN